MWSDSQFSKKLERIFLRCFPLDCEVYILSSCPQAEEVPGGQGGGGGGGGGGRGLHAERGTQARLLTNILSHFFHFVKIRIRTDKYKSLKRRELLISSKYSFLTSLPNIWC